MIRIYGEYKQFVAEDRRRYGGMGHLMLYLLNSGYKLSVNYRRCRFLSAVKWLFPLYQLQRFRYNRLCVKFACEIPSHATIGPGLRIDHPAGIVINSKAKIGRNFTVKSGVVVGRNDKGAPIIGDDVQAGVHALIIGKVRVGNNCNLGAGAIVTHDVNDGETVVCDPAHVLIKKASCLRVNEVGGNNE